jgi:hypothetical protein
MGISGLCGSLLRSHENLNQPTVTQFTCTLLIFYGALLLISCVPSIKKLFKI